MPFIHMYSDLLCRFICWVYMLDLRCSCLLGPSFSRSVYVVYTVLGDVSIFLVGKDEYDELACEYIYLLCSCDMNSWLVEKNCHPFQFDTKV